MINLLWPLFTLFTVLQILDIITTVLALEIPGNCESTKVTKAVMDKIGVVPGLVLLKLVVTLPVAAWIIFIPWLAGTYHFEPYLPYLHVLMILLLAGLVAKYVPIVLNNWKLARPQ